MLMATGVERPLVKGLTLGTLRILLACMTGVGLRWMRSGFVEILPSMNCAANCGLPERPPRIISRSCAPRAWLSRLVCGPESEGRAPFMGLRLKLTALSRKSTTRLQSTSLMRSRDADPATSNKCCSALANDGFAAMQRAFRSYRGGRASNSPLKSSQLRVSCRRLTQAT